MRQLCLILTFISLFTASLRSEQLPEPWQNQYLIVKDLGRHWMTIDENNRYVPYIEKSMADVPVVGVVLPLTRYRGSQLMICAPANSAVLIEKQMAYLLQEGGCTLLNLDSLYTAHGKENILVSIYQPQKNFEEVNLWVVQPKEALAQQVNNPSYERSMSMLNNFFTVTLLILLTLYAILINYYSRIFKNLYSLAQVFTLKVREENTRVRLINDAHLMFLIQHCLLLSFLLIMLVATTDLIRIDMPYLNFHPKSFGGYMLLWVEVAILVFSAIWLKYILIMIFGSLFRLKQLRYLHMLDFMRMSLIFSALLFLLLIICFAGIGYYHAAYFNYLIYLFIAFASIRVIVLYFRLFRSASFRNVYLFSYICIAEVIPLLVGLEILVV